MRLADLPEPTRMALALALFQKRAAGPWDALKWLGKAYKGAIFPNTGAISPAQSALVNFGIPGVVGGGGQELAIRRGQNEWRQAENEQAEKLLGEESGDLAYWQNPTSPDGGDARSAMADKMKAHADRLMSIYKGQPAPPAHVPLAGDFSFGSMSDADARQKALQDTREWVAHQRAELQRDPKILSAQYLKANPEADPADVQAYVRRFTRGRFRDVQTSDINDLKENLTNAFWRNKPATAVDPDIGRVHRGLSDVAGATLLSPKYWRSGTVKDPATGRRPSGIFGLDPLLVAATRVGTSGGLTSTPYFQPEVGRTWDNFRDLSETARQSGQSIAELSKQMQEMVPAAHRLANQMGNVTKNGIPIKVEGLDPEQLKKYLAYAGVIGLGGVGMYGLHHALKARAEAKAKQQQQLQPETAQ